jgi:hypothetical protein
MQKQRLKRVHVVDSSEQSAQAHSHGLSKVGLIWHVIGWLRVCPAVSQSAGLALGGSYPSQTSSARLLLPRSIFISLTHNYYSEYTSFVILFYSERHTLTGASFSAALVLPSLFTSLLFLS